MIKAWSDDAWNDYVYWYEQGNKSNIKKITSVAQIVYEYSDN